jgi:hypothetical protein
MGRPPQRKRMPVVLMVQEVQSLLSRMAGTEALLAVLLDGSGLRLREALGWAGGLVGGAGVWHPVAEFGVNRVFTVKLTWLSRAGDKAAWFPARPPDYCAGACGVGGVAQSALSRAKTVASRFSRWPGRVALHVG